MVVIIQNKSRKRGGVGKDKKVSRGGVGGGG